MIDFDTLFRRYSADVLRFSLYLCGNEAEAEDLTSEAFLRAWTSTEPVRVGTIRAYLFMIVRNLHRDRLRRRERTEALSEPLCDPRPSPDSTADQRSELERVLAAVQNLPEADRAVLAMAVVGSMSYELIAAALGISISAVKVRLHRARIKLKLALEMQYGRSE